MPLDHTVAIVDPDDVLAELGLDDSSYTRIERLVNAASARLERTMNTVFRARDITRVFDGGGYPALDLGGPIVQGTAVTVLIDGVAEPATGYTVDYPAGRLVRGAGWPVGLRNIAVTAKLGYDPIPHEAVEAVIAFAKHLYRTSASGDLKSERLGDYSYERFEPSGEGDLPADVEALVLPYRRWRF